MCLEDSVLNGCTAAKILDSLSMADLLALEVPHSLNFSCAWICQEKAPYEAKSAKRKSEYEKLMTSYNKKQVNFL